MEDSQIFTMDFWEAPCGILNLRSRKNFSHLDPVLLVPTLLGQTTIYYLFFRINFCNFWSPLSGVHRVFLAGVGVPELRLGSAVCKASALLVL